jgi:Mn-dependent DtxR family transcriptional regulator
MLPVDDLILEYLRDKGAATPKAMGDDLGKNNNYVGVRCRELTDYGLLQRVSHGLYRITEDGEKFLDDELDADKLEKDDS